MVTPPRKHERDFPNPPILVGPVIIQPITGYPLQLLLINSEQKPDRIQGSEQKNPDTLSQGVCISIRI